MNRLRGISRPVHVTPRVVRLGLWAGLILGACGSGERAKDTGAGANQPVPSTINCKDFCARLAHCVVTLCNEDTKTTNDTATAPALEKNCLSNCSDADAQKLIPQEAWSCAFQSSCRMTFDYDDCHGFSTYTCH